MLTKNKKKVKTMNNTTFKLIEAILSLAVSAGLLPALYKLFQYLQSLLGTQKVTKKTKVLNFALDVGKGAVAIGEKLYGTTGEVQAKSAELALKQRLQENGYGKYFTDSQITQIVQSIYASMKAAGEIAALKTSNATVDYSNQVETQPEVISETQSEIDTSELASETNIVSQ